MAFAEIIGAAAYLGVAVLGRGGFAAFFSRPPLIALAAVLFVLCARIRAEERLLRATFDGPYEDYCSRTARLIPGLW